MPPQLDEGLSLVDSIVDLGEVIPSRPRQQRCTGTTETSTEPQRSADAAVQVQERRDVYTQSEMQQLPALYEAAQVASFLVRAERLVSHELAANLLEAESIRISRTSGTHDQPTELLFTLHAFSHAASADVRLKSNTHGLRVTALAWTKTGQTLAAGFGRLDITGWSSCPGALATWNLARQGGDSSPGTFLELEEGLTALAFHPTTPGLLAGGGLRGSMQLWDLSQEGDLQLSRSDLLSDCRHQEPVTGLSWHFSPSEARLRGLAANSSSSGRGSREAGPCYRLFSLGMDGRLLMWRGQQLSSPLYGWEVTWAAPNLQLPLTAGGTCLSAFPPANHQEEGATVIIGANGGHLLKCQVGDINEAALKKFAAPQAPAAAAAVAPQLVLRSAVRDSSYSRHPGQVTGVAVSPFQRQLFLSCGTEGCVRLYDVLRHQPLLVLEPCSAPLLAVAWSPSRPLVFAAAAGNGCVYLYDLAAGQQLLAPVLALEVAGAATSSSSSSSSSRSATAAPSSSGSSSSAAVYSLAFNHSMPNILAAAAGETIKVWRLPTALASAKPCEEKLLRRLLEDEDPAGFLRRQQLVR